MRFSKVARENLYHINHIKKLKKHIIKKKISKLNINVKLF